MREVEDFFRCADKEPEIKQHRQKKWSKDRREREKARERDRRRISTNAH